MIYNQFRGAARRPESAQRAYEVLLELLRPKESDKESKSEHLLVEPVNPQQVFHSDPFLKKSQNKSLKAKEKMLDKTEGPMKHMGAHIISLTLISMGGGLN